MNESHRSASEKETSASSAIVRALATLDLILEMRVPGTAEISADGKRVAFVVYERIPGEQKYRGRIWIVPTDGSEEARPITRGKRDEFSPCWSPDGKKLAFVTQSDGERVAIGGWSNGGYLSAWAVTQTDRFKAAMMGAGISDWLNMHAQTDIPDADVMLIAADPLVNPEAYHRCSPITFADHVRTTTLILHGEDDPAVPVAQAYAFYRALRERNVPVECVIYPREGHGLSERDHIRDATERELRWYETYVK